VEITQQYQQKVTSNKEKPERVSPRQMAPIEEESSYDNLPFKKKAILPNGIKNSVKPQPSSVLTQPEKTRMQSLTEVRISTDTLLDPNFRSNNTVSPESESFEHLREVITKKPASKKLDRLI